MKRPIQLASVLLTVLATSSLMSCSDAKKEERAEEKDRAEMMRMEEAEKDLEREREVFIADARARIDKNKEDIADLKAAARERKGEAKQKYEEAIDQLQAENDRLEARIDESKDQNHEKWENFKQEFNHDMEGLGTSIGNLFKDNEK
jgi:hypothetical protein